MSASFGSKVKLTIFGESHGPAIGGVLDGLRAGIKINAEYMQAQMLRRAPGGSLATPRKEADAVRFLSGIKNGYTTGSPLAFMIENTNTKSRDYSELADMPRPSHSDFPARIKYGGFNDFSGGGHFSGRLTAVLVAAGSIARSVLEEKNIRIGSHLLQVGNVQDAPFNPVSPELDACKSSVSGYAGIACIGDIAQRIAEQIEEARRNGDSVGGSIECAIVGLPVGIGEPFFDSVESRLAHLLFSIPGVKGVTFGAGDEAPGACGSRYNDELYFEGETVKTYTNRSGGINGGLTNGMPVVFTVKMRPTPSVFLEQRTVNFITGENHVLNLKGRHDPCIVLRSLPVVEACAALTILDLMEEQNHEY